MRDWEFVNRFSVISRNLAFHFSPFWAWLPWCSPQSTTTMGAAASLSPAAVLLTNNANNAPPAWKLLSRTERLAAAAALKAPPPSTRANGTCACCPTASNDATNEEAPTNRGGRAQRGEANTQCPPLDSPGPRTTGFVYDAAMELHAASTTTSSSSSSSTTIDPLDRIVEAIRSGEASSIAFLVGAGISTASGIPDFRSPGGMYDTLRPELLTATEAQRQSMRENPTSVVSWDLFSQTQLPYLELRRPFILGVGAGSWRPTLTHLFMRLCDEKGLLRKVFTQNIDGLEFQAGIPQDKVVAVHGSLAEVACEYCAAAVPMDEFRGKVEENIRDIYSCGSDKHAGTKKTSGPSTSSPILCDSCGKPGLKPTTVLYGRSLPSQFAEAMEADLPSVDLLIVAGTSLTVSPANSVVNKVPGTALRLVANLERVGDDLGLHFDAESDERDGGRDFLARAPCDAVCLRLVERLGWVDELAALCARTGISADSGRFFDAVRSGRRVLTPLKYRRPLPLFGEEPERPERIRAIHDRLDEDGLLDRCTRVGVREATAEEILLCHTREHMETVMALGGSPRAEGARVGGAGVGGAEGETLLAAVARGGLDSPDVAKHGPRDSFYANEHTGKCALLAAGSTVKLCEAVVDGKVNNGFADVRPPGHHCESCSPMGFCFLNSVAIAARAVQESRGVGRVLIVDWDVHHGNATQHMCFEDDTIMYVSLHRHDEGAFYPGGGCGAWNVVGGEVNNAACGTVLNVPWNTLGVLDNDGDEEDEKEDAGGGSGTIGEAKKGDTHGGGKRDDADDDVLASIGLAKATAESIRGAGRRDPEEWNAVWIGTTAAAAITATTSFPVENTVPTLLRRNVVFTTAVKTNDGPNGGTKLAPRKGGAGAKNGDVVNDGKAVAVQSIVDKVETKEEMDTDTNITGKAAIPSETKTRCGSSSVHEPSKLPPCPCPHFKDVLNSVPADVDCAAVAKHFMHGGGPAGKDTMWSWLCLHCLEVFDGQILKEGPGFKTVRQRVSEAKDLHLVLEMKIFTLRPETFTLYFIQRQPFRYRAITERPWTIMAAEGTA